MQNTRLTKLIPWGVALGLMSIAVLLLLWHGWRVVQDLRTLSMAYIYSENWINTFRRLMSMASVGFLLTIVAGVWVLRLVRAQHTDDPENAPPARMRFVGWGWALGFMVTMSLVVGLLLYVDPRGFYGTGSYEPRLLLVRGQKIDAYKQLDATPDIVVMGTSRAFTVSTEFIHESLGYTAFNMSVEGARMSDYVIQARFLLDHNEKKTPKVFLVEITPPLLEQTVPVAQRSPMQLIRYMDFDMAKLALEIRGEALFDLQHLAETAYVLRYYQVMGRLPEFWTFDANGNGIRPPETNLEAVLANDLQQYKMPLCPRGNLSEEGIQRLGDLLKLAEKHDIALVFYIAPRHPVFYDAITAQDSGVIECEVLLEEYMHELTATYPFVFFLNFSHLDRMGGMTDETGYYDHQHMTALNNNLLITAAADTIHQAYNVAMQKRTESEILWLSQITQPHTSQSAGIG